MTGTCTCCARPADATPENEGYSDCCNDRIAYGDEAAQLQRTAEVERLQASGATRVELLNSWGGVTGTGYITGTTVYYGKEATYITDSNGHSGLHVNSENSFRVA